MARLDEYQAYCSSNEYRFVYRCKNEQGFSRRTNSIQYTCESIKKVDEYKAKFAAELQEEHTKKFKGKFVAFRTLLEVVNEF
jgi:hypothetical protein